MRSSPSLATTHLPGERNEGPARDREIMVLEDHEQLRPRVQRKCGSREDVAQRASALLIDEAEDGGAGTSDGAPDEVSPRPEPGDDLRHRQPGAEGATQR